MSTICIRLSRTELEIYAGKGVCASPFLPFFCLKQYAAGKNRIIAAPAWCSSLHEYQTVCHRTHIAQCAVQTFSVIKKLYVAIQISTLPFPLWYPFSSALMHMIPLFPSYSIPYQSSCNTNTRIQITALLINRLFLSVMIILKYHPVASFAWY